jgi:hypothetical protein
MNIFLKRRLDEPSFELTKPSTGQEYRVARNKEKRKEKKKLGIPALDTSPGGEELKPTTKEQADQG